jgi:uncharacterized protein (DUF433 family)
MMENTFKNIESNPDVLNGKPCIKGTRISVQMVLEWLANGASADQIADQHPLVTRETVLEVIRYASLFDKNDLFIEVKIAG